MKFLPAALAVLVLAACGSDSTASTSGDATSTLRAAADTTAKAPSFVASIPSATATYQEPDRVIQLEHGTSASASAASGGSVSSEGPSPSTITKVFIGDQYYEGDAADGETPTFTVATRCADQLNLGDATVRILQAIARDGTATQEGTTYTFTLPQSPAPGFPMTGTATIENGFVTTVALTGSTVPSITIDSIGTAPPVTAPSAAQPTNLSCG